MNRSIPLSCMSILVAASFAVGQMTGSAKPRVQSPSAAANQSAAPNASGEPKPATQPGSLLPPNTTVLTINGLCEVAPTGTAKTPVRSGAAKTGSTNTANSTSAGNCKTAITRAEFEKVVNAVAPSAPPSNRRRIADSYIQLLTAANEGIKLGLDKDPEFPEQLALMRLQILANDAIRKLRTEASTVSDADAKTFFDQNPSAFEEVTLTRIFVPRSATPATGGQQQPTTDSEAIAKSAREQLVAGGDPDKIEKSVYEQLKTTSEPPTTKFGSKRRGALPPAHEQKVFAAKAGEVTDIIPDSVGYVIYRVDAKQQLPFDQVKDDAKRRISNQRLQDLQQQFTSASKAADYNDAYFGPETPVAPPVSGMGAGGPRGAPPSAAVTGQPPPTAPAASNPAPPQQSQPTTPKE